MRGGPSLPPPSPGRRLPSPPHAVKNFDSPDDNTDANVQRPRVVQTAARGHRPSHVATEETATVRPRWTLTVCNALLSFHADSPSRRSASATLTSPSTCTKRARLPVRQRVRLGRPVELVPVFLPAGSLYLTWLVASFFVISSLFPS